MRHRPILRFDPARQLRAHLARGTPPTIEVPVVGVVLSNGLQRAVRYCMDVSGEVALPGDINRYLDVWTAVWPTLICVAVALVTGGICYRIKDAAFATRVAGWLLLMGSIVVILAVTFLGRPMYEFQSAGPFTTASNWVPFRDILIELRNVNHALGLINVFGNVVLFVPTGFLAGLLFRPTWSAWLLAPVLSACIEVTQSYVGLSADIDDIILNTLGGVLGVALALLVRRLFSRSAIPEDTPKPASAHQLEG